MTSQVGPRGIFILLLALCGLLLFLYTTFLQETHDKAPVRLNEKSTISQNPTNPSHSLQSTQDAASVRRSEDSTKITQNSVNSPDSFQDTHNTAPMKLNERPSKIPQNPTNPSHSPRDTQDTASVRRSEDQAKIPQDSTNSPHSLHDRRGIAPLGQIENSTKIPQNSQHSLKDSLTAPMRQGKHSTKDPQNAINSPHSPQDTRGTAPLRQIKNSTKDSQDSINPPHSLQDTRGAAPLRRSKNSTKISRNTTNSPHSLKNSLTAPVRQSENSTKIAQDSTNSQNSMKITRDSTNSSHSLKNTQSVAPVTETENSTQNSTNSQNSTKIPENSANLYNFSKWDSFDAVNYPHKADFALLSTLNDSSKLDLVTASRGTNVTNTANITGTDSKKAWKVLLWTNFYGAESWHLPMPKKPAPQVLDLTWCPTRCVVTLNRHDPKGHDALMFHGRNGHKPLPTARTPDQLYVFFLLESPIFKGGAYMKGNNFYNWTASYSQRSDVFCPYFRFQPINSHNPEPSSKHLNMTQIQNKLHDMKNSTSKKTGLVAWIVSNCNTASARQFYAEQLNHHIKVDIYGKCGNLKCLDADCHNMLSKTYKFYLAFENSVCEDYVTEKLATALNLGMVPIVLGARRYEQLLPPHSYIDITQFTTVKMLAKYLQHLDRDDKAYLAYHAWRRHYRLNTKDVLPNCVCALCTAMEQRKDRQTVNADEFWNQKACDNGLVHRLIGPPRVKT